MLDRLLGRTRTFRHGVHPAEHKELTRDQPIERMTFPREVILPLSQHLGKPSRPVVNVGDRVYRGQLIAEADGFVSVPLHASATGTVKAIRKHQHPTGRLQDAIIIECDPSSPQTLHDEHAIPWQHLDKKALLDEIQHGGFVGLGGAAFPTHVKFIVPEGKRVEWFMINGSECEPYLTTDHRIMLEYADSIFLGTRIVMRLLGAARTYIGVEINKWDAIQSLRDRIPSDLDCEIIPLETKYPQGAEKMLIEAVLHREVPSGKLPIDTQVVVSNVGTIAGIGERFSFGQPLIERVLTVSGPGIANPSTLLVPIGTKLGDVVEYCGGLSDSVDQVLFGGPMMGTPQFDMSVPIVKGTSGIVALSGDGVYDRSEYPCIRCAACLDACPVFLNPSQLGQLARTGRYSDMLNLHILDCMECGSCSYVCPSNIPLVQRFRIAKAILRETSTRKKAVAN